LFNHNELVQLLPETKAAESSHAEIIANPYQKGISGAAQGQPG